MERRSSGWWIRASLGTLVFLLLGYVLSFVPVVRYCFYRQDLPEVVRLTYLPLLRFMPDSARSLCLDLIGISEIEAYFAFGRQGEVHWFDARPRQQSLEPDRLGERRREENR
jgi:hypothetical protein